jgi:hypothetical protein
VQQLLRALTLLLDELATLPEAQPAKKAPAGGSAAEAPKEEETAAARARSHGALPARAVSAIRDALTKAGVADKLPPAARKVGGQVVTCSCWHGRRHICLQAAVEQASDTHNPQLHEVHDKTISRSSCTWWLASAWLW